MRKRLVGSKLREGKSKERTNMKDEYIFTNFNINLEFINIDS